MGMVALLGRLGRQAMAGVVALLMALLILSLTLGSLEQTSTVRIVSFGTPGDDNQTDLGTPTLDLIAQFGFSGKDIQYAPGGEGDDNIVQNGGSGGDRQTVRAGYGDDYVIQEGGGDNDEIHGEGGTGKDVMTQNGGSGDDYLIARGDEGSDRITILGEDGDDTIRTDAGGGDDTVRIEAGPGADTITYNVSSGRDVIAIDGGEDVDVLIVNAGVQEFQVLDQGGGLMYQQGASGSSIRVGNTERILVLDPDGKTLYESHQGSEQGMETVVDIYLPSESTGSPQGKLAVRVYLPTPDHIRYPEGAPVVVIGEGGAIADGLVNSYMRSMDDVIVMTFIYPGGENLREKRHSDGVYDYRGLQSIAALRDVILYAAGQKRDANGKLLGDLAAYDVLYDNVGFIGFSFGGNIGIAVAALEGDAIRDHLKYVIQWETPVSSQIATRDLGRMLFQPINSGATGRTEFFNPNYISYGPQVINVDYSKITYNPNSIYPVFIDGNGDGIFTVANGSHYDHPTPDLNDNGELEKDEDFGLDTYWYDTYDADGRIVFSRPVMEALLEYGVFGDQWPSNVATVAEAESYWDIRESVRMYQSALQKIPDLKGMFLLSDDDHVQSDPHKSHAHQAFDGWTSYASWFKINPDKRYLVEVDPSLEDLPIPELNPNTAPSDWEDHASYCMPETIKDETYRIAAVHQMADMVRDENQDRAG